MPPRAASAKDTEGEKVTGYKRALSKFLRTKPVTKRISFKYSSLYGIQYKVHRPELMKVLLEHEHHHKPITLNVLDWFRTDPFPKALKELAGLMSQKMVVQCVESIYYEDTNASSPADKRFKTFLLDLKEKYDRLAPLSSEDEDDDDDEAGEIIDGEDDDEVGEIIDGEDDDEVGDVVEVEDKVDEVGEVVEVKEEVEPAPMSRSKSSSQQLSSQASSSGAEFDVSQVAIEDRRRSRGSNAYLTQKIIAKYGKGDK